MKHDAKHTPGPWHLQEEMYFYNVRAVAAGVSGIAVIQAVSPSAEQARANARLIAAAPKMLEALEELARCDGSPSNVANAEVLAARVRQHAMKAIAEAKGLAV